MNGKPSDLKSIPYSSVFARGEHEGVAVYMRDLLIEYGDEFRTIGFLEFKIYCIAHGYLKLFPTGLLSYYRDVFPYLESAYAASIFSSHWNKDLSKVN
jgi:hypothetical protein